jgi:hypothetical protein
MPDSKTLRNRAKRARKGRKGPSTPWVTSQTKVASELHWALKAFKKAVARGRKAKAFRKLRALMQPLKEKEGCTSASSVEERCDVTRTPSEPTSETIGSSPPTDTDAPPAEA